MNTPNENLVREVVAEVLGRLRPATTGSASAPSVAGKATSTAGGRRYGIFTDVDAACQAAAAAFRQLRDKGMAGRERIIDIVKSMARMNAAEWARIELAETRIGRLDHKIEKLQVLRLVPGVEFLHPYALSGDRGIALEEHAPFGVIAAVTPSTHSIPTLSGNVVSMVAAGNAIVFNPHPGAARCAALAARAYNEAIYRDLGIENLVCVLENPTLEGFAELCRHDLVNLLVVTGGPGVVAAAMKNGRKRAICAGPGNPPVLVDETADIEVAAQRIIEGASFDNNLLCVGEKEVFVVDAVWSRLLDAMAKAGASRLDGNQLDRLTKAAFVFPEGQGAGCAHPAVSKKLVGQDASVLAKAAGLEVRPGTPLLFAETEATHPFVEEEQMMPFLPIVRVRNTEEGIEAARQAEHGYRHTAIIHSKHVGHMTAMGRALDTTIFVKNGACVAGLGIGGEGYLSYTIATPTGEGVTNPRTFTRIRRCVMADHLRII